MSAFYADPYVDAAEQYLKDKAEVSGMNHHPTLHRTGRHGCWCVCRRGWKSRLYTTVSGAHLAFGVHLLDRVRRKAGAK